MARPKIKKNKQGIALSRIDWELIKSKHYLEHGQVKTMPALSAESGLSRETLRAWEDNLPAAVNVIRFYMKQYDVTFEELVKDVHE